jgi:hypothetical protein
LLSFAEHIYVLVSDAELLFVNTVSSDHSFINSPQSKLIYETLNKTMNIDPLRNQRAAGYSQPRARVRVRACV